MYWNLEVLAYNTKMVPGSEIPKTWEDLLAPRWKGQIGLEEEDVDWYTAILQLMGEEKGKDFMRGLAAQRPQIRTGHTLLAQLIGAGEFALAPTIRIHQAETMRLKGAPIEWTAIEPLAPNPPISISIAKNAVHPNMARLFTRLCSFTRRTDDRLSVQPQPKSDRCAPTGSSSRENSPDDDGL